MNMRFVILFVSMLSCLSLNAQQYLLTRTANNSSSTLTPSTDLVTSWTNITGKPSVADRLWYGAALQSANLTFNGTTLTTNQLTATALIRGAALQSSGAATDYRDITWATNGSLRWDLGVIGAESGSNAGSNMFLARYADNGAFLGSVFDIYRATGLLQFNQEVRGVAGSASTSLVVKSQLDAVSAGYVIPNSRVAYGNGTGLTSSPNLTFDGSALSLSGFLNLSSINDQQFIIAKPSGTEWNYASFYYGGTRRAYVGVNGNGDATFVTENTNKNVVLVPNGTGTVDVSGKRITNGAVAINATDFVIKSQLDGLSSVYHPLENQRLGTSNAPTFSYVNTNIGFISSSDWVNGFQIRNITGAGGLTISNYANSQEWLRLHSTGNLSLGSTSDFGSKVGIERLSTYNAESSAGIYIRSGTGATNTGLLIGTDKANNIAYLQSVEPSTSYGTKKLVLNPNGGNVGVGVVNPLVSFHQFGNEARFGGVANGFISLYNQSNRGGYIQSNLGVDLRIASDTDPMTFFVNGERMKLNTGSLVAQALVQQNTYSTNKNTYRDLMFFDDNTNSLTGAFVIETGMSTAQDNMVAIKILGYNYSGHGSWSVTLGGYVYNTTIPTWLNHSAQIDGNPTFSTVRLGRNPTTGKYVIILGGITDTWNYPKIHVSEMTAGYSTTNTIGAGWSGSFKTDLSPYTGVVSVSVQKYFKGYGVGNYATTPAYALGVSSAGNVIEYTPITTSSISGTTGYMPVFTGTNTVGNSGIFQSNPNLWGLGTASPIGIYGATAHISSSTGGSVNLGGTTVKGYLAMSDGLGNGVIGTSSNHPFIVITNGIERSRVFANGNVLVGTGVVDNGNSLQVYKSGTSTFISTYADVNGSIATPAQSGIKMLGYGGELARIAGLDFSANVTWSGLAFSTLSGANTLVERARFTGLNGNFLLGSTTDSGEKFQVTGTAKFTSIVSVGGAGLTEMFNVGNSTQNVSIKLESVHVTPTLAGTSWITQKNLSGLNYRGGLLFEVQDHNGTAYYRREGMYLNELGNLGIGITPTQKLHVAGNIFLTGNPASTRYIGLDEVATGTTQFIIQAGAGSSGFGGAINLFGHSHSTRSGSVVVGISAVAGTTGSSTEGRFVVSSTATTQGGVDLFTVLRSGNVGIGTTSPSAKLDVIGTGSFTGTVTVGNATASGHAINLGLADGRYGFNTGTNNWTGANTFNQNLVLKDAVNLKSVNAYVRYLSFQDAANSEAGWFGYGSASNNDFFLYNSVGNLRLYGNGVEAFRSSNIANTSLLQLDMTSQKIANLLNGTASTDAINKGQLAYEQKSYELLANIDNVNYPSVQMINKSGYSSMLRTSVVGGSTAVTQEDFDYNGTVRHRFKVDNTTWSAWYYNVSTTTAQSPISGTLLHSGNYNTYAPTLTGTGASGTWAINITGTAAWANITGKPANILYTSTGDGTNNTNTYINARVLQNSNTTTNNDGMFIGYNNSNSGVTRIYGGGATSGGITVLGSGLNDVAVSGYTVFHQGNYNMINLSSMVLGTLPDARLSTAVTAQAGNWGQMDVHGAFTDYNNITRIGASFLQGSTNAPSWLGASNGYQQISSLGSQYPWAGATASDYAQQTVIGRTSTTPYFGVRWKEAGVWSDWNKIWAGKADVLTTPRTINGTSFDGSVDILTTEWLHSARDFPNGTLITTNINYAVSDGDAFLLEIKGNTYGNVMPMNISVQGYIYSNTIINLQGIANGRNITGLVALNSGGNLCFWFPTQGYWNGYAVNCMAVTGGGRNTNRVTSITHVVKPAGATKEVSIPIAQSIHGSNYTSEINLSNLTTGTLPDARLSANVALDNQNNSFSASQTINTSAYLGLNIISSFSGYAGMHIGSGFATNAGGALGFRTNGTSGFMYLTPYTRTEGVDFALFSNTGNLSLGSITDSGEKFQVTGTSKFTGAVTITGVAIAADATAATHLMNRQSSDARYFQGVSASVNYVPKVTSTGVLGNSQIFENGSGVGINTTNIKAGFNNRGVAGNALTSGTTVLANTMMENNSNNSILLFGGQSASPYGNWLQSTDKSDLSINYPLQLQPKGGNVIINGYTDNGNRLQVTGDANITSKLGVGGSINSSFALTVTGAALVSGNLTSNGVVTGTNLELTAAASSTSNTIVWTSSTSGNLQTMTVTDLAISSYQAITVSAATSDIGGGVLRHLLTLDCSNSYNKVFKINLSNTNVVDGTQITFSNMKSGGQYTIVYYGTNNRPLFYDSSAVQEGGSGSLGSITLTANTTHRFISNGSVAIKAF